jgi:tellurite resistance protein
LRCGSRILIVGSTPDGLSTLSEITDPVEVDYLAGVCSRTDAEPGVGQAFKPLLNKYLFATNKNKTEKKKPAVAAFRTMAAERNPDQTNLLARQSLQAAQEIAESDGEIHYE